MNNHLVKELAGPPRETGTKLLRSAKVLIFQGGWVDFNGLI